MFGHLKFIPLIPPGYKAYVKPLHKILHCLFCCSVLSDSLRRWVWKWEKKLIERTKRYWIGGFCWLKMCIIIYFWPSDDDDSFVSLNKLHEYRAMRLLLMMDLMMKINWRFMIILDEQGGGTIMIKNWFTQPAILNYPLNFSPLLHNAILSPSKQCITSAHVQFMATTILC